MQHATCDVQRADARPPRCSTTEHIFTFWDLLPTAAELAGAALPPRIDGVSAASVRRATIMAGPPARAPWLRNPVRFSGRRWGAPAEAFG
jgi:arylsulfatase A-like enzyme